MVGVIDTVAGDNYQIYNGDCVEVASGLPDESVGFVIYSPPFSSLYTYSNSDRDMGNCRSDEEFFQHFQFLIAELYRVLKPGRLMAVHCMNLPASKQNDGLIGIKDFRGDLIRAFQSKGFIYHSEVCIWKDPVIAMQRTKAIGLLHKQLQKDSTISRQGIPDYLVVMRKPGVNPDPVDGPLYYFVGDDNLPDQEEVSRADGSVAKFPKGSATVIDVWQRYASPIWMDINQARTLQFAAARENDDERHICPLQLDVIERAIELWTNPKDVVLSPFMGIGSEVYQAVKMGRYGIGIELKKSYYDLAVKNLKSIHEQKRQLTLI